jgi:hypothetical protein
MARPHNLSVAPGGSGPWRGTVAFTRPVGPLIEYHVRAEDGASLVVVAMRQAARPIRDGDAVTLSVIDPALCAVYPAQ